LIKKLITVELILTEIDHRPHSRVCLETLKYAKMRQNRLGDRLLGGMEWLVVVAIVAIILLWGPSKLPELAKALGKAKGEFDKASREFKKPSSTLTKHVERPSADVLIETAKKLGINTEGKTKEQISKEIVEKVKAEST
jgi:sec-independent protein translocase protein TatA